MHGRNEEQQAELHPRHSFGLGNLQKPRGQVWGPECEVAPVLKFSCLPTKPPDMTYGINSAEPLGLQRAY